MDVSTRVPIDAFYPIVVKCFTGYSALLCAAWATVQCNPGMDDIYTSLLLVSTPSQLRDLGLSQRAATSDIKACISAIQRRYPGTTPPDIGPSYICMMGMEVDAERQYRYYEMERGWNEVDPSVWGPLPLPFIVMQYHTHMCVAGRQRRHL